MKNIFPVIALFLLLSGCGSGRLFYDKAIVDIAKENPELISYVEPPLLDRFWNYKGKLTDVSPEKERHFMEEMIEKRDKMKRHTIANHNLKRQLNHDILYWYLSQETKGEPFLYYNYPINQLHGVQSETPALMISLHGIHSLRDARSYIKRLRAYPKKFEQTIEGMEVRKGKGIIPPIFVLEKVIRQMEEFIEVEPQENALWVSLKDKMEKTNISSHRQKIMLDEATAALNENVYPAYGKLIEYCRNLLVHASTDDGVWKFPDGQAFYAHILKTHTTSSLTPDEVHAMGLKEVEKLEKEAGVVFQRLGIEYSTVGEALATLAKDPRFLYPETEEGRMQCLKEYQRLIEGISMKIPEVFDIQPKSKVEVHRVPVFKQQTAAGAYYEPPSLDGKRPGIFFANLRSMKEIPQWGMATLAFHEAVPGHHFQLSIQQDIKGVPIYRKIIPFTAYMEGWALYAEQLAVEMKAHKDDYSLLGYYQAQLFRAVRLVVDTGIHAKKWTREQAIAYMLAHTGMPKGDVTAEIERYIVEPGQACAYKVGQLKILELREKARQSMGTDFSLKYFHNMILKNGAMPLEIMDKVNDDFIHSSLMNKGKGR